MNVQSNQNQPSFSAKFIKNKAFQEVVDYAAKTKQLNKLDTALNNINNVNPGEILLIHGKNGERVYSNFNMNQRSVQNLGDVTPEKASFKAILELGELGRKFRRLVGGEPKSTLTAEKVIEKYGK